MNKPKLIQLDMNKYVYVFPDGSKSPLLYFADEFCENRAVVSANEFGGYQYLDMKNRLSETFAQAFAYSCGLALVQKYDNSGLQFRNKNGKLSREFYSATSYKDGYSKIRFDEKSPRMYRDILGHVSLNKTFLGDLAYSFYKGEIDTPELPDDCFIDPEFFQMIKEQALVDACWAAGCMPKDKNPERDMIFLENYQYIVDRLLHAKIALGEVDYPFTKE